MGLVPDTKPAKVSFFQSKITPWTTNATAIGTTSTAVTALGTLVTAAAAALAAQDAAEGAFRSAVSAADNAVDSMAKAGADIISAIRTKARTAGDGVYDLAQIPAPATPGPVGPPGTPNKFTVDLDGNGSLILKWKCTNPGAGTMYQVWRRTTADGEFSYVGASGEKKFVDSTIPMGTSQVTYQIQAQRSTAAGAWAQFNVNFSTGTASVSPSVVETATPKMAA